MKLQLIHQVRLALGKLEIFTLLLGMHVRTSYRGTMVEAESISGMQIDAATW